MKFLPLVPFKSMVRDGDGLESHHTSLRQEVAAAAEKSLQIVVAHGFDHLDGDRLVDRPSSPDKSLKSTCTLVATPALRIRFDRQIMLTLDMVVVVTRHP